MIANYLLGLTVSLGMNFVYSAARKAVIAGGDVVTRGQLAQMRQAMGDRLLSSALDAQERQAFDQLLKAFDATSIMVFYLFINHIIPAKYEERYLRFINNPEPLPQLSWREWGSCMFSGKGCDIDQRRMLFFKAGISYPSIIGYDILKDLVQKYMFNRMPDRSELPEEPAPGSIEDVD